MKLSLQKQQSAARTVNQRDMNLSMTDALRNENRQLRIQLDELLKQAHINERKLRRLQTQEMELLGLDSLADVLHTLTVDYPRAFDLAQVTLVLVDSDNQIQKLLEQLPAGMQQFQGVVLLPDVGALEEMFQDAPRPRLGSYHPAVHGPLFGHVEPPPVSVALLPLLRRGRFIGCLNMGGRYAERFAANKDTYFLERLATTVAVCVENAINHERLANLGLTDPLTEVNNRRFFDQRLEEEIMRTLRGKTPLACLLIDVDHFKRINDNYGHQTGDSVLRQVAAVLRQHLRGQDVLARYGGEEFVALLSAATLERAGVIAERIRMALEQCVFLEDDEKRLHITASIGVSVLQPQQHQGEIKQLAVELVERSDQALYKAKESGRNRVVVSA